MAEVCGVIPGMGTYPPKRRRGHDSGVSKDGLRPRTVPEQRQQTVPTGSAKSRRISSHRIIPTALPGRHSRHLIRRSHHHPVLGTTRPRSRRARLQG